MGNEEPLHDASASDEKADKKKKKKAEKARGVWISFAGRIIAQVVGAVASVVLGILVLQRYQTPPSPAPTTASPQSAASPAGAVRRAASAHRSGETSIAVLPLDNLSREPERDYFAAGMTEAIIADLARVNGLRVISRSSTMQYRTQRPPIPAIAEALDVDLVVEGSVLLADGQVRITVQLIDGDTDEHLWAKSYNRRLSDVIALQDAVATAIATEIKGTVSSRAQPGAAGQAVDPAAYDLYLRGRHALNIRTADSMAAAIDYFSKAVARDPSFALGHVGLADAYALQGSPSASTAVGGDRLQRAKSAALRALELDANLAEAYTALGGVQFFGERDFRGAEASFRRAIELNPNYPVAHEWLGILLAELGREDESLKHADMAVKLDPLSATMHMGHGMVHYNAKRYVQAAASERRALELTPQLPIAHAVLVKALTLGGDAQSALAVCDQAAERITAADFAMACAVAAVRAGNKARADAARAALEARRPRPMDALAQLDAATGNYAAAFRALQPLAANGSLPPVFAFDPLFAELRGQPEWPALAERWSTNPRRAGR